MELKLNKNHFQSELKFKVYLIDEGYDEFCSDWQIMDELPGSFFQLDPHTKRCKLKNVRPNFIWKNRAIDKFVQLTKENNLTVKSINKIQINKTEFIFEIDIFCGNL